MTNLILLEWNKLKKKSILLEVIIYILCAIGSTFLFLVVIDFGFTKSYSSSFNFINLVHRMTFTLLGASLICQVVIDEYKNKTISIIYGYPIKKEKIVLAKIMLIISLLLMTTFISYIVTGATVYAADLAFNIISGMPTTADFTLFVKDMLLHSLAVAFISLIPLFYFGIIRRGVISTIIFAIVMMQLQNVAFIFDFYQEYVILALVFIGVVSAALSVITIKRFGRIS